MKKLLNPWWIFFIHTLPFLILFIISFSEYSLIKSLLSETEATLWGRFCIGFIGLIFLNITYAVVKLRNKQKVDWIYSIINSIISVIFLCFYYESYNTLIPWNVPSWMLSGNQLAYTGAFFMPAFLYNTFCLVLFLTKNVERKNPWLELLYALLVPFAFYILVVLINPLWSYSSYSFSVFFLIGIIIIGVFVFLFFALRFFIYFTCQVFF